MKSTNETDRTIPNNKPGILIHDDENGPYFFKIETHKEDTKLFLLIQNKLHWHIYRLLCSCTVSEKLPKIPLFGPSLIHQLWLPGSQQHLQNGVLLTSFST